MKRLLESLIESKLEQYRVVILIGQRQVGKTFQLQQIQQRLNSIYLDMEDEQIRSLFRSVSIDNLESLLGDRSQERMLLLDEIQYLPKVGSILKLIHDHFPKTQVVATGSASFLLLRNIGDSLYGRHKILTALPLTFREALGDTMLQDYDLGSYSVGLQQPQLNAIVDQALIYGMLPPIFLKSSLSHKEELLQNYVSSLLFKDVFEVEGIRKPEVFRRLLLLLAFQIGSEINTNELASQLSISRNTVVEYLHLYEKFQIIHLLKSYSTNPRKEITKGSKVYFVDLGIRNAVMDHFAPLDFRQDTGALFENLVVNLFHAHRHYLNAPYDLYYWRNQHHAEVDLVLKDRYTGQLTAIEIKYQQTKQPSRAFLNSYHEQVSQALCINRHNLGKFI